MANHHTAYCKKSVAELTPEQLLRGIRSADLHTIAEDYDLSDAVIADALRQLRIETATRGSSQYFRICYRPDGQRQIDLERWPTAEEVEAVKAEVLQELEGEPLFEKVSAHLGQTVDIVSASFGSSQEEGMAPVIASEAVRWLAEQFDGIS